MPTSTIDLSADLAEGAPTDADLLALITTASVACGAHAGDRATATRTCELAARAGVVVGAHPGHPDRAHMGRRPLPITAVELTTLLTEQIDWLTSIAAPGQLRYLKLHGALYHQAAADAALAQVTVDLCDARSLGLLAPPSSLLASQAQAAGITLALEGFPDRAYTVQAGTLTLAPRSDPRAMLGPAAAAEQACRIALDGEVRTLEGELHRLPARSLCVHGDAPGALAVAEAIRAALRDEGLTLRSFAE